MCFSIPYKVLRVEKDKAIVEGGQTVKVGNGLKVHPGEYLRIAGDVAVGSLSKLEGLKIRKLIKSLDGN